MWLLALPAALAAAACAMAPSAAGLTARAEAIRTSLGTRPAREGYFVRGEVALQWKAWIEHGRVVYLVATGDSPRALQRYVFDEARLLLYEGHEVRGVVRGVGASEELRIRLLLAPDGTPVERLQLMNGRPAALRDFQIDEIKARAEDLRRTARQADSASP